MASRIHPAGFETFGYGGEHAGSAVNCAIGYPTGAVPRAKRWPQIDPALGKQSSRREHHDATEHLALRPRADVRRHRSVNVTDRNFALAYRHTRSGRKRRALRQTADPSRRADARSRFVDPIFSVAL